MSRDFSAYDPLLHDYLAATGECRATRELERVVAAVVPVIHEVIRNKTGTCLTHGAYPSGSAAEELSSVVRTKIAIHLHRHRQDGAQEPIRNLRAYVRRVAERVCIDHFRKCDRTSAFMAATADIETEWDPPDLKSNTAGKVVNQLYLEKVWAEIRQMTAQQRKALLLGLDGLILFPVLGIASLRQIAAAIGISSETLACLWNRLPLDDNKIAECLHRERQGVINIRSSARKRLARRMADWR